MGRFSYLIDKNMYGTEGVNKKEVNSLPNSYLVFRKREREGETERSIIKRNI